MSGKSSESQRKQAWLAALGQVALARARLEGSAIEVLRLALDLDRFDGQIFDNLSLDSHLRLLRGLVDMRLVEDIERKRARAILDEALRAKANGNKVIHQSLVVTDETYQKRRQRGPLLDEDVPDRELTTRELAAIARRLEQSADGLWSLVELLERD